MNILQYIRNMNQKEHEGQNHDNQNPGATTKQEYETTAREDEIIYDDGTNILADHDAVETWPLDSWTITA